MLPKEYRKTIFSKIEKENLIQQKIKDTNCLRPKIINFEEILSSHEGKMLISLMLQKEANNNNNNDNSDNNDNNLNGRSKATVLWKEVK